MPLRSHHISGLVIGALALVALSVTYGLRVAAEETSHAASIFYPGSAFVGNPKTVEDVLNCRIFGRGGKEDSFYYLREDITDAEQIGSAHELVCFATEKDAKAQGFKKKKPPAVQKIQP